LISTEVFQVSPVILIEALEAVVDIDGGGERTGESEGNFAWRSYSIIGIGTAGCAGRIVLNVDFLTRWG
jgi:hypothetical protein